MALGAGTRLGPYEIVAALGAGGMGEVYQARDTRLDRTVAIKVLPSELSTDPERRARFEREARTIAALNHPHICTLHDIGQHDGSTYLVMEHLAGETLAQRLRKGPLPVPQALEVGAQIAEALDAAHTLGIVHRDLKPSNVMLTPNGAKLLDFGLAKLRASEVGVAVSTSAPTATASLTQAGEVLGTRPYMAPEQVEGKTTDARTDVWAFGCMLYEMVAGQPAFTGGSSASITAAILDREPPPLTTFQPLVPEALVHVVQTCLAKDPNQRWQTTADLSRELRWIAAQGTHAAGSSAGGRRRLLTVTRGAVVTLSLGAALVGLNTSSVRDYLAGRGHRGALRSVVVLPLANLTGRSDQQVHVDGLTDMIGTELGTVGALTVKAGPSMKQVDSSRPVPDIARQLDVDAILFGSVHRVDERVALSLRLVQASPERVRWARNFDTPAAEVLTLPKLVAQAVAEELAAPLSSPQQGRLTARRDIQEQAWYLVNRSRQDAFGDDPGQRIRWLEDAIALEPTWAVPHAELASWLIGNAVNGQTYPPDYTAARKHAEEALRLDPGLAEANAAMASLKHHADWDWDRAEALYTKAITLNPSAPALRNAYGWYLLTAHRFDEALEQYKRAQELDPLGRVANWEFVYLIAERYDEALAVYRAEVAANMRLESEPKLLVWLAQVHVARRDVTAARQACDDVIQGAARDEVGLIANCGFVFAVVGAREAALDMKRRLEEGEQPGHPVDPFFRATVEAGLGHRDRTFALLDQAWRERAPALVIAEVWPAFSDLHGDPRFQALLRRINHPRATPALGQVSEPISR